MVKGVAHGVLFCLLHETGEVRAMAVAVTVSTRAGGRDNQGHFELGILVAALKLLAGEFKDGDTVRVDADGNALTFTAVVKGESA